MKTGARGSLLHVSLGRSCDAALITGQVVNAFAPVPQCRQISC